MPKVIAITSEKGGVGKSTLAVHLSGALAERGLAVTLIDEDGSTTLEAEADIDVTIAPGLRIVGRADRIEREAGECDE